ncbi:hypothetical protein [Ensifer adhaerens]
MVRNWSKAVGFAATVFLSTLATASSAIAGTLSDGVPVAYGNWEGVCDDYQCIVRSNRSVLVVFDKYGYFIVDVPVKPNATDGLNELKITLPNGTTFVDLKRFVNNGRLRMYVPDEYQKGFASSKKFSIESVGGFDIRNFQGIYEAGAFILGIND